MNKSWKSYKTGAFFDELITPAGRPRVPARRAVNMLQDLSAQEMALRREAADLAIREMGISFTIYNLTKLCSARASSRLVRFGCEARLNSSQRLLCCRLQLPLASLP